MLTALRIGNFKAFAETQRIPIRPLDLDRWCEQCGTWHYLDYGVMKIK